MVGSFLGASSDILRREVLHQQSRQTHRQEDAGGEHDPRREQRPVVVPRKEDCEGQAQRVNEGEDAYGENVPLLSRQRHYS